MIFRRKRKVQVKRPRVDADQVVIGAAKSIGSAIGAAAGAVEIGRRSAAEARNIDTKSMKQSALERKEAAARQLSDQVQLTKKMAEQKSQETRKQAKRKAEEAKKMASLKAAEAKKMATAQADKTRKRAEEKVDELREAAADKIAPKKKRRLLPRLRG